MQGDGLQEMWRRIEEVRYWEGGGGSHQRVGAAEATGGPLLLVSLPSEWHPALAVSLGDLKFRPGWLEGEDTCGLEQPSIPEPPSGDTVFPHYYSELIHMVKVRPAPPPLPGPLPGVAGYSDDRPSYCEPVRLPGSPGS